MIRVFIAIRDVNYINQFKALRKQFVSHDAEFQYNITFDDTDYSKDVVANSIDNPYDMTILPTHETVEHLAVDNMARIYRLNRFPKALQQVRLQNIYYGMKNKPTGFTPIPSWSFKLNHTVIIDSSDITGPLVLKPRYGARSLGIIKLPAGVNVNAFLSRLGNVVMKNYDQANAKSTLTIGQLETVVTKFNGSFTVGEQRVADEFTEHFKPGGEWVIQQAVPEGFDEYRGIADGTRVHVLTREHRDGTEIINDNVVGEAVALDNALFKEINSLMMLVQPYGSFDLWVSKDKKQWGIFEYQPQYGQVFVDAKLRKNIMENFIDQTYRKHFFKGG